MAIKYKTLYTTLQSGINTYTFTDDLITSRSKIAIWTDDDDVYPLDAEIVNTHSVAIAISDHINPVEVALVINNIEEFDPDAAAGVSKLSELTDVLISSATNGQYLVYNGSKWINKTVTIPSATSDLSDVDYTGLDGGQVLMYNNVTSKWVNAFLDSSHIADSNYTNLKAATDKLVEVNTALNSKQDSITPNNKLDYSLISNTPNLSLKQNVTDNSLNTSAKTVVGAINELNTRLTDATITSLQHFPDETYYVAGDANNYYVKMGKLVIVNINVLCVISSTGNRMVGIENMPKPMGNKYVFGSLGVTISPSTVASDNVESMTMGITNDGRLFFKKGVPTVTYMGSMCYLTND